MLHILFLILKIIGIILLILLGILILSLGMVLFVPVRYQLKAKTEDGFDRLTVSFKATWFLHLMSATADYREKKADWQVRILWKKLHVSENEAESSETESSVAESNETDASVAKEAKKETVEEEKVKEETVKEPTPKVTEEKDAKKSWFQKIKCTIRKICDKIKGIGEMKTKITDFLTDEIHLAAFGRMKSEILILVKHLGPRKVKGFIRFGMEDPYNTGQVLAILSLLYPFYGENLRICPEFEKKILEADVYMKGHIRAARFAIILWNLFFDHNVRKTYKNLKMIRS